MGVGGVEHGSKVTEGAVSACFPFRRREDAHESLHEGVGEKAFPVVEDAVEVLGELVHGCEPRVLGVEDSDVAHPGTQTAVRPSVVGAGVSVPKGRSHPVGLGRAQVALAGAFEACALGLGEVFGILQPQVAVFFIRSPHHGSSRDSRRRA